MGHLPLSFLSKWNDLPPGRLIPQALGERGRECRDLVMGLGRGRRVGRSRAGLRRKTATPRRNPQARRAMAVTGLTIHDIVMAPAIPVADLFQ